MVFKRIRTSHWHCIICLIHMENIKEAYYYFPICNYSAFSLFSLGIWHCNNQMSFEEHVNSIDGNVLDEKNNVSMKKNNCSIYWKVRDFDSIFLFRLILCLADDLGSLNNRRYVMSYLFIVLFFYQDKIKWWLNDCISLCWTTKMGWHPSVSEFSCLRIWHQPMDGCHQIRSTQLRAFSSRSNAPQPTPLWWETSPSDDEDDIT